MSGEQKAKSPVLRRQPVIRRVLAALIPCIAGAVYFFGWRCLAMIVVASAAGFITEYIFCRMRKEPVSEAVFVTAWLFALIMPASCPWHVLVIGVVFAVMFGKEVFGGFGRNIFNPAIVGRAFVYICFPVALTAAWPQAAGGLFGALGKWQSWSGPQAITGASVMANIKAGKIIISSDKTAADTIPFDIKAGQIIQVSPGAIFKGLALGRVEGTMGVTSVVLICIGGVYLFITKTASRATILSMIITYAVLNQTLYMAGVKPVAPAWAGLMSGGFLFGVFFMATDPVSSPRTTEGKIIYAIIIAICTLVIRNFSIFNGGLMFSILIGNMFAPIIDIAVKNIKNRNITETA